MKGSNGRHIKSIIPLHTYLYISIWIAIPKRKEIVSREQKWNWQVILSIYFEMSYNIPIWWYDTKQLQLVIISESKWQIKIGSYMKKKAFFLIIRDRNRMLQRILCDDVTKLLQIWLWLNFFYNSWNSTNLFSILLLHLQPVILHLAEKAIGSLGPVTKQLLETPDGIGSPAVITAEKCAWTWSVSKHEENKTSSKASWRPAIFKMYTPPVDCVMPKLKAVMLHGSNLWISTDGFGPVLWEWCLLLTSDLIMW